MKKLTIGSAVYDDFEGVYFSYQSLRLNNLDILDDLDLLVIDNNPDSAEGKATKEFCNNTQHIRYIPYTEKRSTAIRNEIFNNSEAKFCMSIDPHVLFEPDTIKRLISFFESNPDTHDLYHGPMFYDVILGHDPCSKMDPIWRDNMFGTWATDERGNDKDNDPFEIEMHGLGIFACKTESWLGFHEDFIGFGGEEGYIHKKFKKAGHTTWCLPFLRWIHRFQRPLGVKYPLVIEERIRNYLIGHQDLGLPFDEIIDHFKETQPQVNINTIIDNLDKPIQKEPPKPPLAPVSVPTDPKRGFGQEIKIWEKSEINFAQPTSIRYLKYEFLHSYDGHSALQKIDIGTPIPKDAKIVFASSEEEENKATNVLQEQGAWVTSTKRNPSTPHELVVDFGEDTSINKITTFARPGLNKGIPVEFKVYSSDNMFSWEEISHVDILED